MKKYFISQIPALLTAAMLLAACTSDVPDSSEITSGTTINALVELPSEITSAPAMPDHETTAAASEPVLESETTTISDTNYAVQTSVGKAPEQTAAAEIETTVVYTSETSQTSQTSDLWEGLNPWNTTAKAPEEAEKAAKNEETSEFSARIISVDSNSISVEVLSEKWINILGSFAQINTTHLESVPECSPGDYAEIVTSEEIGITEANPLRLDDGVTEIKITKRSGIELPKNSVLARIVNCNESFDGEHYAIVVQAFYLKMYGYEFETEISMRSNEEFSFGDWVKITFAEDTLFMESYPLQVSPEYVLGIEKV